MLFVLDVGNTNTVLGVFEQDQLKHEWRIKTDRHKTEDEFGVLIKSLFDHKGISFSDIHGIIISSVVPPIMFALEKMCTYYFNQEPLIIGKDTVQSFLKMGYPNPKEIGADRIVNAVGAIAEYGAPLVIIDFGTATTYCYINEKEEYQGGSIAPGIHISMEALYSKASKLPKIEIQAPEHVVGKTTVEAMQSGVFYGYVGQVDGIVTRIKQQATVEPKVVATGGLASLISDASTTIDYVDKHLTLKGLYLIYQKNMQ
ncbi:type III pantothenate kinase [Lentibacillus sp. Marseille-P4043]|uniref:type III pantothenate kinase n=1 Tax=Lentibacillus sp. Marseille-P4043 TaxID=2040293 RepID=UPI000D0B529B|nr:type III pantothenate kinase [Lentibacillus sp. Marseille-P4043]